MTSPNGVPESPIQPRPAASVTVPAKGSLSDGAAEYRRKLAEYASLAELEAAQRKVDRLIVQAGVPTRHLERDLDANPCAGWESAQRRLFDLAGRGSLVVIHGPRGCGKTQLAVSAIVVQAQAGRASKYIRAMDLFRTLRDSLGGREEVATFARFVAPPLLVIDEIQDRADTQFEDATLANLIDHRYAERRDTVLISTATPDDLSNSLPTSIISRVHETGGTIACNWPSFRVRK